jgi:hypothetical protein
LASASLGRLSRLAAACGAFAFAAQGCGALLVWDRPGSTEEEFRRDATECARSAEVEKFVPTPRMSSRGRDDVIELAPQKSFSFDLYRRCMEERGYRQVPRESARSR